MAKAMPFVDREKELRVLEELGHKRVARGARGETG